MLSRQALGNFLSEYKGFRLLDRSMQWAFSVLQLEDTQRKIGKFALPVVPWNPLFDAGQFGPPLKKSSYRPGTGGSSSGSLVGISRASAPLLFPILDHAERGCGTAGVDDDEYIKYDKELEDLLSALKASVEGEAGGGGASSSSGGASSSAGPAAPEASVTSTAPDASAVGAAAPKAAVKKKGGGGKKYDRYPVHAESGEEIGYFLIDANAESLDMHCSLHGDDCAISRSYREFDGPLTTPMRCAKGRCAAFLVAWRRWGAQFSGEDGRTLHMHSRFSRGTDSSLGDGAGKERVNARKYVEERESLADVRLVERQPRPGEPIEPLGKL